jgi:hypothetical protein
VSKLRSIAELRAFVGNYRCYTAISEYAEQQKIFLGSATLFIGITVVRIVRTTMHGHWVNGHVQGPLIFKEFFLDFNIKT